MQDIYKKNWLFRVFIFMLCFSVLLPVFTNIEFSERKQTFALNENKEYDKTYVLDDLEGATFDGKVFNTNDFPKKSTGQLQVIAFTEYCFSYFEGESNKNYGLYIYVYNPQQLNLSQNYGQNKILLANSFVDKDVSDWRRHPADYSKFNLEFLSVSEGLDNNGESLYMRFYKFKVVDNELNLFNQVREYWKKHDLRRYYVSEVEFLEVDKYTSKAYLVATMFEYTGYAEGYYYNNLFPLVSKAEPLEVAELDVRNTFYRTLTSSVGAGHQNQLDSVYFGVDNRFWELYGELQKIKAEWYEYKTKEILVSSNSTLKTQIPNYLGVYIPDWPENNHNSMTYGLYTGYQVGGEYNSADWSYNNKKKISAISEESCNYLYYFFPVDSITFLNGIGNNDPYSKKTINGMVQSNELYDFIKKESLKYGNYLPDVKEGTKLSSNLFLTEVDKGRTRGYNCIPFEVGKDIQKLLSYDGTNPSFWDNAKNYGFWNAITGKNIPPAEPNTYLDPILIVNDRYPDILTMDNEYIRELLKISDVTAFKDYYSAQKIQGKKTVLFRYAVTDYYCPAVTLAENTAIYGKIDNQAYYAQETCFFDFDIIQMHFVLDQTEIIIPCVSSPIDIVDAITPGYSYDSGGCTGDFLNTILTILLVVFILFLIIILSPVLPSIVNGAVAVIKLPFQAGSAVVNSFKKDKYKKQQKHYSKSGRKNYKRKKRY